MYVYIYICIYIRHFNNSRQNGPLHGLEYEKQSWALLNRHPASLSALSRTLTGRSSPGAALHNFTYLVYIALNYH